MAKSINPAFQAAPDLGGTSYNPLEFAQRHNLEKFQIQKRQKEEQERNTAQGLSDLMLEVKGWEDQEGFKEIMADQDRIMNGFLTLSRKGMNLVSPKTTQEIMAYKAIRDAHSAIKQKVDTWGQQKAIYDLYQKAIEQDSILPVDEQRIAKEASMANIQKVLKSKSIIERGNGLQNLLVTRPEIGDVDEYLNKNKDRIPKLDTKSYSYNDENGQLMTHTEVLKTPEKEKEIEAALRNLYKYSEPRIKNAIKRQGEINKGNEPVGFTDEDRFVARGYPAYAEKFIDKAASSGSGFSVGFNFLGASGKITPGEHQTNDLQYGGRNFNDRYDFSFPTAKSFFIPPLGGEYSTENEWKPITGAGGPIEGNLQFYDPTTDKLIFKVSQDARYPWIKNNTTIAIPRKNLAKADDLPIKLDNGKTGKLKQILPTEATPTKKKMAYNPKTGKFE